MYSENQIAGIIVNNFYIFPHFIVSFIYTLCDGFAQARMVEPYPEIHKVKNYCQESSGLIGGS
jgi:phytoene/squalene synthetase